MQKCAEAAWKSLNGVICVYKPSHSSCSYVKNSVISNLCNDLNALQTRPVQNYLEINHTNSDISDISIKVRPSYADNTLCVGPRYQPEDFEVYFTSFLSTLSSGVLVLGINEGQFLAKKIAKFCQPKCYQVKGILGIATEKFYIDDRVIARAKYHRVTKCLIDKLVASYQASYQNRLFQECNVNPQSQEAYELATSDILLPNETKSPAILGLKCIEFKPPEFTLEVHCIFEKEIFLMNLIHSLGISLKSYATCSGLRCIKNGIFTVEHALLKKQWNLHNISENMELCLNTFEKCNSKKTNFTSTSYSSKAAFHMKN